jgi:hypothetical protein
MVLLANRVPNGLVLMTGSVEGTSELYNPATRTWTVTGSMNHPRYDGRATLLPNGKVLVAGGWAATGFIPEAELYDPATAKSWTDTGSLATPRRLQAQTLMADGRVLVAQREYGLRPAI